MPQNIKSESKHPRNPRYETQQARSQKQYQVTKGDHPIVEIAHTVPINIPIWVSSLPSNLPYPTLPYPIIPYPTYVLSTLASSRKSSPLL